MADLRDLIGTVAGSHFFACPIGVAVGSVVYISGSGAVDKALAKQVNPDAVGVVIRKPTTTSCLVVSHGSAAVFAGLTPGAVYYLSAATAGEITSTPPSGVGDKVQPIGTAISATELYVDVTFSALVGSAGDHSLLSHLGFAESGHTGFEPEHVDEGEIDTFTYLPSGDINTITQVVGAETITSTFDYLPSGDINTITQVWSIEGKTKTSTFNYTVGGDIDHIDVVWS